MRSLCSPASAAGLTYSGVGALSLLGRLPLPQRGHTPLDGKTMSAEFIDNLTRWLISRQTLTLQDEKEDLTMDDDDSGDVIPDLAPAASVFPPTFQGLGAFHVSSPHTSQPLPEISMHERQWVGVNGRCNKVADTCYTFWVGGTMAVSSRHAVNPINL